MPTYAYACTACGHRFEVQQSFTDSALTECPECAGRLRKLFNTVGIVFKGSGFYRTDSRGSGREGGREGRGRRREGRRALEGRRLVEGHLERFRRLVVEGLDLVVVRPVEAVVQGRLQRRLTRRPQAGRAPRRPQTRLERRGPGTTLR